jgi:hypothetical protein
MPANMHVLGGAVREAASFLTRARFIDLNQMGQWGVQAWDAVGAGDAAVLAAVERAGYLAEQWRSVFTELPRWPAPNIFLGKPPSTINPIIWGTVFPPLALLAMAAPYIGWKPIVLAGGGVAQAANGDLGALPADYPAIAAMGGPVYEMLSAAASRFNLPNPANIPGFSTNGRFSTRGCCESCEQGLPCEDDCKEHVH